MIQLILCEKKLLIIRTGFSRCIFFSYVPAIEIKLVQFDKKKLKTHKVANISLGPVALVFQLVNSQIEFIL